MRRGLVLGAGGVLGYTWSVCALRRLEQQTGWDPRTAEVIVGTSAGSVIAARLGAGTSAADLLAAHRARLAPRRGGSSGSAGPPRPSGWPSSWRRFGAGLLGRHPLRVALTGLLPRGGATDSELTASIDALVGPGQWVAHPRCFVIAMDEDSGRRVAFGRADAPPAGASEAVRASCAVPGWFRPVQIGGRRYVDGGVVSPTSLDLLAGEGLDEIVVISPLTSARVPAPASLPQLAERALRLAMSRVLAREIEHVRRAGTVVRRIEPTAHELARMGANFMDPRRRPQVVQAWHG